MEAVSSSGRQAFSHAGSGIRIGCAARSIYVDASGNGSAHPRDIGRVVAQAGADSRENSSNHDPVASHTVAFCRAVDFAAR